MHRVTPDHYNLYDEREELVGTLHRLPGEGAFKEGSSLNKEAWFGHSATKDDPRMLTGFHPTRHHAARDLLDRHARTRQDLGMEG